MNGTKYLDHVSFKSSRLKFRDRVAKQGKKNGNSGLQAGETGD
jgi:hypothetical protein